MNLQKPNNTIGNAKRYSSLKYALAITDIIYTLALLLIFLGLGISQNLAEKISRLVIEKYFVIPIYILAVSILYYLLELPLNFYRSYTLEHKFSLSNQTINDWAKDQLKAGLISYVIVVVLLEVFYCLLGYFPGIWWLFVSLFWLFFSLFLAKLVPIIIIPLFFKYKIVSDNLLRERIINLAQRMKVKILDVFEIDFSKKTLKANAAFVGLGRTKRVILADTLKDKYTYDEIEVILAHEFAHYRLGHLLKLILVNSAVIIFTFYLLFRTSSAFLRFFNLSSLSDIAAFPLVASYMFLAAIVTQPLENYLSRRFERNADMLAIKATHLREAFISMMEKLTAQNLADRNPHPIIKVFFFDHPPVDERINMAKSL